MRRISATAILIKNNCLETNLYLDVTDNGVITAINKINRNQEEVERLEYYSGVIIPAFVWYDFKKDNDLRLLEEEQCKQDKFLFNKGIQATNLFLADMTLECISEKLSEFYKNFCENNIFDITSYNLTNLELSNMQKNIGTLSVGKAPGILLLNGFNFNNKTLDSNIFIERLI